MHSRRDFLRLSGIALAGSQLGFQFPFVQAEAGDTIGRTLMPVSVYAGMGRNYPVVENLWPDRVIPILDIHEDWYRVPGGYVRRETVQPMLPPTEVDEGNWKIPFWGYVSTTAAAVREYCAMNAPLVTRIGHGGVAHLVDYLPGEPGGWYAVADDEGTIAGWSQ